MFAEISEYKSESERSLDAACEKMEEALKLEDERDSLVICSKCSIRECKGSASSVTPRNFRFVSAVANNLGYNICMCMYVHTCKRI